MSRRLLALILFAAVPAALPAAVAIAMAGGATPARAAETIILQSTTSTLNSGLLDHILPLFEKKTGIRVKVVAVGTGQALRNARNGDGDVVLVHARDAELAFVREGWGVDRREVMHNDFVIVCPAEDPAGIAGMRDAAAALRRIAARKVPFVSRGDDSGTHRKELKLWAAAGVDPRRAGDGWYRESGAGMGATLNMAAGMGACTLTDRATWLAFRNRSGMRIMVEGDPALFNQYGVMLVNPRRHPHVKEKAARAFIDWLTGPEGQKAIAGYRIEGRQVFFPDALPDAAVR
ncbi:MAG TPA: extracellular solute-binding protein [Thermopetrobacter sp.]|nr:extracellular solute-binding protein [Thermopetrobacter sp.]